MRYNKKKLILAMFFPMVLVVTIILYCFPQKTAVEHNTQRIIDKVSIPVIDTTLVIDREPIPGDTTLVIECGPIPGSQEGFYEEEEEITKDSNDVR